MTVSSSTSDLSEEDRLSIDLSEADAFSALFEAARPHLGTGSTDVFGARAIWNPVESEAGYSYLVNMHLASDLDAAYARGLEIMREAGCSIYGIPVDNRISAWASEAKLAALGLTYESDELIWARPVHPDDLDLSPGPPAGIEVGTGDIDEVDLREVINRGWDLPPGHTRGTLYASALRCEGWLVYVPRVDGEIAGLSVYCSYRGVGLLMLAIVLPEFRGRGLQTYFIRERIAESARRGCRFVISETNDDNASPRNLQRAGLRLEISRRVFSRPL